MEMEGASVPVAPGFELEAMEDQQGREDKEEEDDAAFYIARDGRGNLHECITRAVI